MPRRKSPNPLYRLCVTYVAGNITLLCPAHQSVVNVFPPDINEDLINALQSYKQSNFASLYHLLAHRLCSVKLSFIDCHLPIDKPSRLPRLLGEISRHGKHLVELSLVGAVHQDDASLVSTLSQLPRLRRLSLCLCNVTDRVVAAIAENCTDLMELKLSGQRTTDDSLFLLAACTRLRSLLLESDMCFDPRVTVASSFQLLKDLRHLQTLKIPFLTEAILLFPVHWTLSLTEYTESAFSPLLQCGASLDRVVTICPRLRKVGLILAGSEAIGPLCALKALSDLALRVTSGTSQVFFRCQVVPLLRNLGANLRVLTLSLPELDIAIISRYCPFVTDLEVEDLKRLLDTSGDTPSFKKLQRLKFFLHEVNCITAEQLFAMLRDCTELVAACLGWCQLTDSSLCSLVSGGTFTNLQELELNEVDCVSGVGLRHLVTAESNLTSLTVFGCDCVAKTDVDQLRSLVSDNNLDLIIRYFEL